ncbi:MAG: phytanoyl-CoA dioxygenase family protein [Planctomycetota bacterium]|nr:phytanoyl-CoA dioxygenase family protein [Planctomycetota bacterium]
MERVGEQLRFHSSHLAVSAYAEQVKRSGCAIVERVIDEPLVHTLISAIDGIDAGEAVRRKRGIYGVRNLLDVCPAVRELAASEPVRRLVCLVLGDNCFAVRAIFFDKIPGANWSLGWHQDNVIAVRERHDIEGFFAWSEKAGVWQVQPPVEILARMLAIRVHLDDCSADNGALRVLPGSHSHGWLDDEIDEWKANVAEFVCEVSASDVVAMCPTLLHASAKSSRPGHRRVIHIEFAAEELPSPLAWRDCVSKR